MSVNNEYCIVCILPYSQSKTFGYGRFFSRICTTTPRSGLVFCGVGPFLSSHPLPLSYPPPSQRRQCYQIRVRCRPVRRRRRRCRPSRGPEASVVLGQPQAHREGPPTPALLVGVPKASPEQPRSLQAMWRMGNKQISREEGGGLTEGYAEA